MRASALFATLVALISTLPSVVSAQDLLPERFRVQLHVSAEERLREPILGFLSRELQTIKDVTVTSDNPDFVLSLVVLPTTAGGYVMSTAVMNVYNERTLESLADAWQVPALARPKLVAVMKGAGALVDQRAQTGPDLADLCQGTARAFNLETLGTARKFRDQLLKR